MSSAVGVGGGGGWRGGVVVVVCGGAELLLLLYAVQERLRMVPDQGQEWGEGRNVAS